MAGMSKTKLAMLGLGIFLAGLLAGGGGVILVAQTKLLPHVRTDRPGAANFFLARLSDALNLDEAQKQTIEPIVVDVLAQIGQARIPCIQAEDKAIGSGVERIRTLLRDDQQPKLDEFLNKAKERRKKIFGH